MTLVHKIAIGLAFVAAIAGGFWLLVNKVQAQSETIGRLESQQEQLAQDLQDSEKSAQAVRQQLEMWQWLYEDLQAGYKEIRQERESMNAELRALKEQQDVQDYLHCPMPDGLYDWLRQN